MISVILPTYNEAGNVAEAIIRIYEALRGVRVPLEVLVMDDRSLDGTAQEASRLSGTYPVRVHVRSGARELGAAVLEGLGMARGSICVVMDADLSHPADMIPELIAPIVEGRSDMAVGSRTLREASASGGRRAAGS